MLKLKKEIKINILFIISIPLALWLGFTGRINWWTILFIIIFNLKFKITYKRK